MIKKSIDNHRGELFQNTEDLEEALSSLQVVDQDEDYRGASILDDIVNIANIDLHNKLNQANGGLR